MSLFVEGLVSKGVFVGYGSTVGASVKITVGNVDGVGVVIRAINMGIAMGPAGHLLKVDVAVED